MYLFIILIYLFIYFRFPAKLGGKYRDFPSPTPHPPPAGAASSTTHNSGIFVKANEPTWIRRHHPETEITSGPTLGGVRSTGLDKCMMTCIHLYSIIQSSFIALNILLCPQPLPPTPGNP